MLSGPRVRMGLIPQRFVLNFSTASMCSSTVREVLLTRTHSNKYSSTHAHL